MAHIAIQMTAHGTEPPCAGCEKPWPRGSRMNGMEYEDGESAGWHCDACVDVWKATGEPARPAATTDERREA